MKKSVLMPAAFAFVGALVLLFGIGLVAGAQPTTRIATSDVELDAQAVHNRGEAVQDEARADWSAIVKEDYDARAIKQLCEGFAIGLAKESRQDAVEYLLTCGPAAANVAGDRLNQLRNR